VETTAPKNKNVPSKVHHVPIQISKGDEHLITHQSMPSYYYGSMGPMPMSMSGMRGGGPPMFMSSMHRARAPMGSYASPVQARLGP
jgi:hypothetical protein